ncbi:hypothetical protein BGW80DRAFT_1394644 [Lactifluus volemus]|nr:hypothetical protein BGW80DRAFT_1394644 [Lactifluus volemus]
MGHPMTCTANSSKVEADSQYTEICRIWSITQSYHWAMNPHRVYQHSFRRKLKLVENEKVHS